MGLSGFIYRTIAHEGFQEANDQLYLHIVPNKGWEGNLINIKLEYVVLLTQ